VETQRVPVEVVDTLDMEESVEDIGSDVDLGGESEEQDICEEPHPEEMQDVMPPPTGPWAKRRRLTEKTKPFIPHGYLVVLPKPLESSRLSRELNAPLFSVQYGSRKRKPQTLAPLSVAAVPTHRPLHAVCGKEDGQVLYSAEHLDRSSSAQLVLNAADDLQDAYSRMPLLASPSTSYKLPEHVQVRWAPDLYGPANAATTDGQAECSPDVARSLMLLPEEVTANSPGLCKSAQFRGVLPLGKRHILCKGMVLVNCCLPC